MQANLETLGTCIGQVADLRDMYGLREGQQMLATRMNEVEECISVHSVREFMGCIMLIESRIGGTGGVIGEAIRNCFMTLDSQAADLEDLRDRMRTQEWYHDLSEQESDDEAQRRLTRAEGHGVNAENQSGLRIVPSIDVEHETTRPSASCT